MANPTPFDPTTATHVPVTGKTPKQLKYAPDFKGITGCPFKAQAAFGEFSYRIVHGKKDHPDNFRPAAILFPDRFADEADETRCQSWALSMFETLDQLKAHFKKMTKRVPNWGKLAGDHSTRLKIGASHGQRTDANYNGHFSFHEYADCDLAAAADDPSPIV